MAAAAAEGTTAPASAAGAAAPAPVASAATPSLGTRHQTISPTASGLLTPGSLAASTWSGATPSGSSMPHASAAEATAVTSHPCSRIRDR